MMHLDSVQFCGCLLSCATIAEREACRGSPTVFACHIFVCLLCCCGVVMMMREEMIDDSLLFNCYCIVIIVILYYYYYFITAPRRTKTRNVLVCILISMRKPIQYPLLAYDARDEMPYVYQNDRFLVTHGSYQNTL